MCVYVRIIQSVGFIHAEAHSTDLHMSYANDTWHNDLDGFFVIAYLDSSKHKLFVYIEIKQLQVFTIVMDVS